MNENKIRHLYCLTFKVCWRQGQDSNLYNLVDTPTAKACRVLMYIHLQTYSKAHKTNELL